MDGKNRAAIKPGQLVDIVCKQDQRTGRLTRGMVDKILTRSEWHSHGIKVRLANGLVGRVKAILPQNSDSEGNSQGPC
ncbi:YwbE family protein [Desulfobulbus alkaliphilus]|uniref:YwbE family protein n=1 Tax=Desulfobulbus alkaliphilus TaxID=869814 RepID=UPI001962F298|nr:YwbE family protein [Desulfobulbus alkaliphilus]MBM9536274.1 YwbE family protein [Desulfobulbus alkaliphilus]